MYDLSKKVEVQQKEIENGVITKIHNPHGVSRHTMLTIEDNKTIHAIDIYGENQLYDVVYVEMDNQGNVIHVEKEEYGIQPELFLGPESLPWVCVVDHMKDNMSIVHPIFTSIQPSKAIRVVSGSYIGNYGTNSIFYNSDSFAPKKKDKFEILRFNKGEFKSKKNLSLSLIKFNSFIEEDEIHVISNSAGKFIHQEIHPDGTVVQERSMEEIHYIDILTLSFTKVSKLIHFEENKFILVLIHEDNGIERKILAEIQSKIYYVFRPLKMDEDRYIFHFTHESGNGWIVMENDKITSCFLQSEGKGYIDLVSGEEILFEQPVIISGIAVVNSNTYCISFYNKTDMGVEVQSMYIMNRRIR